MKSGTGFHLHLRAEKDSGISRFNDICQLQPSTSCSMSNSKILRDAVLFSSGNTLRLGEPVSHSRHDCLSVGDTVAFDISITISPPTPPICPPRRNSRLTYISVSISVCVIRALLSGILFTAVKNENFGLFALIC